MSAYHLTCPRPVLNLRCNAASLGLIVLALLPLLIGCSIHPLPDDVSRKTTYDIVEKIRCEAKAAVESSLAREFNGQGIKGATIVYQFTFNINEQNDASAGFTLFNPFANGTFNVTANGGSNRVRTAIAISVHQFFRRSAKDELHPR